MEQVNNYGFGLNDANARMRKKTTGNVSRSKKCNQCDYASSHTDHLRFHLKTHSGKKSNRCKQCDYAPSYASDLRKHLKSHSGEKSNKCNQCDFAFANLRTHLKMNSGES